MVRLTRRHFYRLVQQAYQDLPDHVVQALENVDVVVERRPGPDLLADLDGASPHDLLGLYVGVPLTQREGGLPLLPDKITLFQRPIEQRCRSVEEVVQEVRVTLLHEVGHYFGMEEEDLERQGYG